MSGGYVSYIRVSTDRQGRSGLGLEAQREAVRRFTGDVPVEEFVEVESGKRVSRKRLREAIAYAKSRDAVLVVAKLDRLARNARFLLEIAESGVEIRFCDLPEMPSGAMGKFFLTMMAAVAELEAGMISERTKAALEEARKRGVELGSAGKERARENREEAQRRAEALRPTIEAMRGLSYAAMADVLNDRGIETPLGGKWHATSVGRVVRRLDH